MSSRGKKAFTNFLAVIRYRLTRFFSAASKSIQLNSRNWKWISMGSVFFMFLFTLAYVLFLSDSLSFLWMLFAVLMIIAWPLLFGFFVKLGVLFVHRIPKRRVWLFFSSIALFFIYFNGSLKGVLLQILYFLFTFIFIFGAASNLNKHEWSKLTRAKKLLNFFFLSIGVCNLLIVIYFLSYPGPHIGVEENFPLYAVQKPVQLEVTDPSETGPFQYNTLTYGSGSDKHRLQFGNEADLQSYSVDASVFIDQWDKLPGKLRTLFWGFGPDSLPLNGRMFLPEGKGPFPVVLVVHGNHLDRDFSDCGYDYIGTHLASHGFLTISVDENFLNAGLVNLNHSLKEENDARAWLLLKHLEFLSSVNDDEQSGLFGKVDLDNVLLIGHSRGGEAVSIAASFNSLSCYPDDAMEKFDFNFGMKGIIAIAPIDGQYRPSNIPNTLSNINYLVLQGSLDADLESYAGLRQFNRITFNDSLEHFKAGIFIQGANHGQFNSTWGINDIGYPGGILLNRRIILEKEEQEKITLLYITSFIYATLDPSSEYKQFLLDYRQGIEWLPDTKYINQYQSGNFFKLADFEEDIDISTSSSCCAEISFSELSSLYEEDVYLRKGNVGTKSVIIGWNNETDSVSGYYKLEFENPFCLDTQNFENIQFDVAVMSGDPGERENNISNENAAIENEHTANTARAADGLKGRAEEKQNEEEAIDFVISLMDQQGDSASIELSEFFPLNPPFKSELFKLDVFNENTDQEVIPQHIEINLDVFKAKNSDFNSDKLKSISFVFSKGKKGLISMDNIGFTQTK